MITTKKTAIRFLTDPNAVFGDNYCPRYYNRHTPAIVRRTRRRNLTVEL